MQGNLLALDAERIYIYSNTLQAIAVGYLLAAPLVLYLEPKEWYPVLLTACNSLIIFFILKFMYRNSCS